MPVSKKRNTIKPTQSVSQGFKANGPVDLVNKMGSVDEMDWNYMKAKYSFVQTTINLFSDGEVKGLFKCKQTGEHVLLKLKKREQLTTEQINKGWRK